MNMKKIAKAMDRCERNTKATGLPGLPQGNKQSSTIVINTRRDENLMYYTQNKLNSICKRVKKIHSDWIVIHDMPCVDTNVITGNGIKTYTITRLLLLKKNDRFKLAILHGFGEVIYFEGTRKEIDHAVSRLAILDKRIKEDCPLHEYKGQEEIDEARKIMLIEELAGLK